ncbi:MAG: helix-turn-helix transcriptional regulator [Erysipelothrix sp.]|nr:helix-turn-helix transcriptional regulator [Erysipelothrix sp.]
MNNNLGKKIYDLRVLNKDSQEDLAQKINTSRQTISKWEAGHSNPDFNILNQIAKLYGKDITYFTEEQNQEVADHMILDRRNSKLLMIALGLVITSVAGAISLIITAPYLFRNIQHRNKL